MCLTSAPLQGFVDIEWSKINFGEWFGGKASAATEYTEGYYTYIVSNNEATIISVDESISGHITVPSTLGGYSVTTIGRDGSYFQAFSGCDNVISVTIPNSVKLIEKNSFYSCDSLTAIKVVENNPNYSSDNYGVLFNKNKSTIIRYPEGNENSTYSIPNSVTYINEYAFDNCSNLIKVTIPNSVTTIGYCAFEYCDSLKEIEIPASVKTISDCAFQSCYDLDRVLIEYGITTIGGYAFAYCRNLADINIPNSVTDIGIYAFMDCGFSTITLPKSITTISGGMFYGCDNLINISIPDSVTSIGVYAFYSCRKLTNIFVPDSVASIAAYAFLDCTKLERIIVDENNKHFSADGNGVLYNKNKTDLIQYPAGNSNISYKIPVGVTNISNYAFYWCEALIYVTIPYGVTDICTFVFYGCHSLTTITIPKSVTNISYATFGDCEKLETVYYSGSEKEWNEILIDKTHDGNKNLLEANIHYNSTGPSDNPNSGDNLNKVNIDFTTDTFEVEVGDTVTVSATVTCPAGVENSNLDMVWEVIDPDGTEIVLDGEYSRSETEWACYAEIKGLKEGTYYINLRDNNSTVFDTVKIVVKSEGYIPDYPIVGGDTVSDKTIYPVKAKISGNTNNLVYDNDWWKWNKKKFQVSGTIDNVLSRYDTQNAAKEYEKKKYYNSIGVNQLENLYITLKSPDAKKIYFKGGKSEITFPLGRTIGAGGSDTFECDVYVDRDYYPPQGSEVITLECILNGTITDVTIGGKEISGVYSTFDIRITNKSYEWEKQSLKELIAELKSMVRPYEAYYRQNIGPLYGGTALFEDMTAVEVAYSAGSLASSLELGETCFDIIYYFSNMNFTLGDVAKEYGKAFMELLSKDSHDKVSEIIGAMESRLLHNEYFDGFIEWCRVNYGVDAGAYAKYSNHCPTDIIVTSEDGKTVLQIVGDQIVICDDYITAYVFESNKTFYLPTDIDHEIKITATDNGTMDYFVETVTTHSEKRVVEYNDITLSKGETYKAIAPNDISSKTDVYNPVSEDGKTIKADKDETEHKYGDKDKNCQLCGFDRTQGCSCKCHKGGIAGFFFKLILFFQKIFKTNQTCSCGVAHY